MALVLPGRVQAPLALCEQSAAVAQQEAAGHGARAQARQERGGVTAGDHTGECARHLGSPQKSLIDQLWRGGGGGRDISSIIQ